jgi:hypothetical protein
MGETTKPHKILVGSPEGEGELEKGKVVPVLN